MNVGGCFLLFFGLFWSSITLGFDGFIAKTFYQRLHAQDFATTTGRVTHSEVVRSRGRKGSTNYRPKIHFAYAVNGRAFIGENFHYGDTGNGEARWAEQTAATFSVGKSVTVHYDAANPADAVLLTGLEGSELFLTLFLTPFNCIMLGIWSVPLVALQRKLWPRPAGVPLTQRLRRTHACLATVTPFAAGMLTLAGCAFAGIFIVGFSTGFNPTVTIACLAWGVVLAAAVTAFVLRWLRLSSGVADLVLDTMAGTLTLPRTCGRKAATQLNYSEVKSVAIEQLAHTGQKGGTTYSYAPTLHLQDGRTERLADWYDEAKARTFAAWLRTQLNLPAETA